MCRKSLSGRSGDEKEGLQRRHVQSCKVKCEKTDGGQVRWSGVRDGRAKKGGSARIGVGVRVVCANLVVWNAYLSRRDRRGVARVVPATKDRPRSLRVLSFPRLLCPSQSQPLRIIMLL